MVSVVTDDRQRFGRTELILVGHGSTKNLNSRDPVYRHAAALRQRGLFARVLEAFWQQPPFLRDAWRQTGQPEVIVVPLMISQGYFTTRILPRELGLPSVQPSATGVVRTRNGRTVRYSRPVGTHPAITGVLLARARQAATSNQDCPPPVPERTALFLVGHGTPRDPGSRRSIEHQVECIRALGLFAEVHPAFIEEPPRIPDIPSVAGPRDIVVVPFFISDGLHVQQDIPVLLGESETGVRHRIRRGDPVWTNPTERAGKRIWYAGAIGAEPMLTDVILERVRQVAACVPDSSG
jgi:sirohydrochlorin cobaltochelatase